MSTGETDINSVGLPCVGYMRAIVYAGQVNYKELYFGELAMLQDK